MMATFLKLTDRWINVEHVVEATRHDDTIVLHLDVMYGPEREQDTIRLKGQDAAMAEAWFEAYGEEVVPA